MLWWFTGAEGVSFPDIKSFIDSIPADDNVIEIEFHSCGGDCAEGWAMYDELRASGKEIHAVNVGICASMATILFLTAKKENRIAREHAEFLIHDAYIPYYEGEMTIEKSQQINADLTKERERLLDVYVERTGTARDILAAQMDTNDFFGAEKALELGFISSIEAPKSASSKKDYIISTTKNQKEMNKKGFIAKVVAAITAAFEEEKGAPAALVLTASDGTELNIEREEGEPQVGDAATPDGTFTLEDGRTIVIEDGVITDIQTGGSQTSEEDKDATISELQQKIDSLNEQIATLTANAKTDADNEILAKVSKAGGKAWLDKVASTHFTPSVQQPNSPQHEKVEKNAFQQLLEEKRAAKSNKK